MNRKRMSLNELRRRNRMMITLGLTIVLVIGNAALWLSYSSAAEGEQRGERSVFLYDTLVLDNRQVAYIGEDTQGDKYLVESGNYRFAFHSNGVVFVRVARQDGRWYIQELMRGKSRRDEGGGGDEPE